MPRPAKGSVITYEDKEGVVHYSLRVTQDTKRVRIPLGTSADGWTQRRAELELETTNARIRANRWSPPKKEAEPVDEDPTFHAFASARLLARRGELEENTYKDYEWRLSCHLFPFFAKYRVRDITVQLVDTYRNTKVAEREAVKAAIAAGHAPRDDPGRKIQPLENESINKTLALLAAILDVAVDHRILASNPARGARRRLKTKRFRRPFLEPDEVRSLLDAAEALDREKTVVSEDALAVKRLRDAGFTYPEIAKELGIPLSTAQYRYRRATTSVPDPILQRRAIIATLVGSGLRVSEVGGLRWHQVQLDRGRIVILKAKTEAGVREVRLTEWVLRELLAYRTRLGSPERSAFVFPTATGSHRDRKNICERIVKKAATKASELRIARGLDPLPDGVTPHALRCTYITLLLEADYPLKYVMEQVGHEDESTTMRIYARVLRRRSRSVHDQAFDGLLSGEDGIDSEAA